MTPPEIIIPWGIVTFDFPIHEDLRGQSHLIPAAPEQAITGHHPTNKETMFLETLDTIFRAGGIHRTVLTIDRRDVCPIELNQKPQGVEGRIYLFLGALARAILIPWTLERSSMSRRCQAERGYKQHASRSDMEGEENGVME
jgi:hypothetical protein